MERWVHHHNEVGAKEYPEQPKVSMYLIKEVVYGGKERKALLVNSIADLHLNRSVGGRHFSCAFRMICLKALQLKGRMVMSH